ncbi:hypothetical protein HanRHA438_Chr09g0410881 [Helianthus annuus]|nr:hypothetical protein HanRHA438_Chr09g0410881 [Helianthus annuus]
MIFTVVVAEIDNFRRCSKMKKALGLRSTSAGSPSSGTSSSGGSGGRSIRKGDVVKRIFMRDCVHLIRLMAARRFNCILFIYDCFSVRVFDEEQCLVYRACGLI